MDFLERAEALSSQLRGFKIVEGTSEAAAGAAGPSRVDKQPRVPVSLGADVVVPGDNDFAGWMTTQLLSDIISGIVSEKVEVEDFIQDILPGDEGTIFNRLARLQCSVRGREEKFIFIVKHSPMWPAFMRLGEGWKIYELESRMYLRVLPAMYEIAKAHPGGFKKVAPTSYSPPGIDCFVLEDLTMQNYKRFGRRDRLEFSHAKQVLMALARLHAMSRALLERNREVLARFHEFMFVSLNKTELNTIVGFFYNLSVIVRQWEGFEHYSSKLVRLSDILPDRLILMKAPWASKFPVLNHGDCWTRNVYFHYSSSKRHNIDDVRFVNFGHIRLCSPVLDILHFLYSSVKEEVIFEKWDDMMFLYWNTLVQELKSVGVDHKQFTYANMKQEMLEMRLYGLYVASTVLQGILPKDTEYVDCVSISLLTEENLKPYRLSPVDENFKTVYKKLLLHFEKLGVI